MKDLDQQYQEALDLLNNGREEEAVKILKKRNL